MKLKICITLGLITRIIFVFKNINLKYISSRIFMIYFIRYHSWRRRITNGGARSCRRHGAFSTTVHNVSGSFSRRHQDRASPRLTFLDRRHDPLPGWTRHHNAQADVYDGVGSELGGSIATTAELWLYGASVAYTAALRLQGGNVRFLFLVENEVRSKSWSTSERYRLVNVRFQESDHESQTRWKSRSRSLQLR